jgi:hypothetical protein
VTCGTPAQVQLDNAGSRLVQRWELQGFGADILLLELIDLGFLYFELILLHNLRIITPFSDCL